MLYASQKYPVMRVVGFPGRKTKRRADLLTELPH
jgi:hypothetical protein